MDLSQLFSTMPFAELVGVEVTSAANGHAEGRVEMREALSSVAGSRIGHGGVTDTLADTVGGAAVISQTEEVAPTLDVRIDCITPATADLFADADVVRLGGSVGVADVDVTDADGHHVAGARGVYKTGGEGGDSPWKQGELARDDADAA